MRWYVCIQCALVTNDSTPTGRGDCWHEMLLQATSDEAAHAAARHVEQQVLRQRRADAELRQVRAALTGYRADAEAARMKLADVRDGLTDRERLRLLFA